MSYKLFKNVSEDEYFSMEYALPNYLFSGEEHGSCVYLTFTYPIMHKLDKRT